MVDQPNKILLVDDDEVVLKTITEYLEQKDFDKLHLVATDLVSANKYFYIARSD